jgi:hypothetical protein
MTALIGGSARKNSSYENWFERGVGAPLFIISLLVLVWLLLSKGSYLYPYL